MIAHLGMYNVPDANDALWMRIRMVLGYGPDRLTKSDDFWAIWQDPRLLFSQTCGYPYRAKLRGHVQLIGTPDYGLPDCPPGYYRSVFIKRCSDTRTDLTAFAGARFAYNEPLSQSGWAAPALQMQVLGVKPGTLVETGSHAASLIAVLNNQADFAALDALTWDIIKSSDIDALDHVVAFEHTSPTPGLPYVTGPNGDLAALQNAIRQAIEDLPRRTRAMLHLKGLVYIPDADYVQMPDPPAPQDFLS